MTTLASVNVTITHTFSNTVKPWDVDMCERHAIKFLIDEDRAIQNGAIKVSIKRMHQFGTEIVCEGCKRAAAGETQYALDVLNAADEIAHDPDLHVDDPYVEAAEAEYAGRQSEGHYTKPGYTHEGVNIEAHNKQMMREGHEDGEHDGDAAWWASMGCIACYAINSN